MATPHSGLLYPDRSRAGLGYNLTLSTKLGSPEVSAYRLKWAALLV